VNPLAERLLPVALLVGGGWLLRRTGVLPAELARGVLRLVFFVFLPALLFVVLARTRLEPRLALLPVVAVGINLAALGAAWLIGRGLRWPPSVRGAALGASGVMMGAFNFSILALLYAPTGRGEAALARGALIDFGNALLSVTVIYLIARAHRPEGGSLAEGIRSLLATPLLWSVLLGLAASAAGGAAAVPAPVWKTLDLVGSATLPLVFLSVSAFLGIVPGGAGPLAIGAAIVAAGCRVGVGWIAGALLAWLLGLGGLERAAVLVMAISPCGSTALVYSGAFRLDASVAANAISLSILFDSLALLVLLATGAVGA